MQIVLSHYIREGCWITLAGNSCYAKRLANTCNNNDGHCLKEINFLKSAMLCCCDVTIRQGEKVLRQDLIFFLHPGERIEICMPSGAGKMTLGRVPADWQKPTPGDILTNDQPLPMHQYCPVQPMPRYPELTFNPRRSTGDAVRDAWRLDIAMLTCLHTNPEWLAHRPG